MTSMETHGDNQRLNNGQLIYVPHKDTVRLLEVYIKRSLSLNDGTLGIKHSLKKEKWVTIPRKPRRHSSDSTIHLFKGSNDEELLSFSAVRTPEHKPENTYEESENSTKKSKKNKKPFWKSLFGIFTQKSNEDKNEPEDEPLEIPVVSSAEGSSDSVITCQPTAPVVMQRKKVLRRKSKRRGFTTRRLSLKKLNRAGKDLTNAEITRTDSVISVEPTYSYYEKVSEELEKIVHEVQEKEEEKLLSDEELINRIVALIKEQGNAIDDRMKENSTLNNFFLGMSYTSFQKLADAYLEKETSPIHNPPNLLPTAPELIKLAFTYDFTAKIARLSKQNVGHITGLGNRYLQDRFEYKQACTDHPMSDSDS